MMRGSINLVQKQAHKKRFDIKGIQEGGSDAEEVTVPRSNNLMGGRKDANYLASKIQFWTRRNEETNSRRWRMCMSVVKQKFTATDSQGCHFHSYQGPYL